MEISDKDFNTIYKTGYETGYESAKTSNLQLFNLSLSMIELELGLLLDNMLVDKDGEIKKEINKLIQKYKDMNKKDNNNG